MISYSTELAALKRSGRYRERRIFDARVIDLASNDYLGLAHNKDLLNKACARLASCDSHAPKASMLVNGYHSIHASFEKALCRVNGYEEGVILGSGFNANIALMEALVRKGDELFMDEKYHASGVLAAKLLESKVSYFKHNDAEELKKMLESSSAKRKIIAVEGIYSMDADLLSREIISLADEYEALLVLDEAHSSGVIGEHLSGILDFYGLSVKENYIKMGTLGKAYGSFGAYILASSHIIDYLVNRAKPIIYATAPSLFDTALGEASLAYIQNNLPSLKEQIASRQKIIEEILGLKCEGLIVPIRVEDNRRAIQIQAELLQEGYLVGAIRQPTVDAPIIRLIARLGADEKALRDVCYLIKSKIR